MLDGEIDGKDVRRARPLILWSLWWIAQKVGGWVGGGGSAVEGRIQAVVAGEEGAPGPRCSSHQRC